MIKPLLTAVLFVAGLLLLMAAAEAARPCQPFEGGRVDAEMLAAMRQAAIEGRMYRIVSSASSVGFCVRHFPFSEFRGEFTNIVGGLALPPDPAGVGHALLLIHTASLKSQSASLVPLATGNHFLDTARYPEILFVGHRLEWLDNDRAHIFGELTLRSRTHPIVVDVEIDTLENANSSEVERIHLRGLSHVSRYSFDMRSHRLFINEIVRLCLDIEFVHWRS